MTDTSNTNLPPTLEYAAIMFADIRGYNNLENTENHQFHARYFPELWNELVQNYTPDLEHANLWGDGIMCIGKNLAKLAEFALRLAEAFDERDWRGNINVPLRLRISLDSDYMVLSGKSNNNEIEQYLSTRMVKPARLEPVVRPGQVWCTSTFREALLERNNNDPLNFIIDEFENLSLYQKYDPDALVARIRSKRNDCEQELQECESRIKEAQRQSNSTLFYQRIQELLKISKGQFVYLSKYLSWYEVIIEMIDKFKLYQEGNQIINSFQDYIEKKGWMSKENVVYFTCFSAKCTSNLKETTVEDLQKITEDLKVLYDNSPEELLILIAKTYKEIAILLSSKSNIKNKEKTDYFIYSHEMFKKIFNTQQQIFPRFFPELATLLPYQIINHQASLNMAETALFIQCLTRDSQIKKTYKEEKENFANKLIFDFKTRKPENASEIITTSLASVILGKKEEALDILRGKTIPPIPPDLLHDFQERLQSLADFTRMEDEVSDAALYIIEQHFS